MRGLKVQKFNRTPAFYRRGYGMPLQAAEWQKSKLKIFKSKKSKLKILSYRRDIYIKIKLRTSTIQFQPKKEGIFAKKKYFLKFSDFHDMLEDPLKFSMFNFSKISKKNSKNGFTGFYQTLKGTKSGILVILAQTLWKWQTISDCPGHNGPLPQLE